MFYNTGYNQFSRPKKTQGGWVNWETEEMKRAVNFDWYKGEQKQQ